MNCWPISEESKRTAMIASAPISRAFSTIRSMAWRRESSSSCVYSLISPRRSALNDATTLPVKPMLRTTRP